MTYSNIWTYYRAFALCHAFVVTAQPLRFRREDSPGVAPPGSVTARAYDAGRPTASGYWP